MLGMPGLPAVSPRPAVAVVTIWASTSRISAVVKMGERVTLLHVGVPGRGDHPVVGHSRGGSLSCVGRGSRPGGLDDGIAALRELGQQVGVVESDDLGVTVDGGGPGHPELFGQGAPEGDRVDVADRPSWRFASCPQPCRVRGPHLSDATASWGESRLGRKRSGSPQRLRRGGAGVAGTSAASCRSVRRSVHSVVRAAWFEPSMGITPSPAHLVSFIAGCRPWGRAEALLPPPAGVGVAFAPNPSWVRPTGRPRAGGSGASSGRAARGPHGGPECWSPTRGAKAREEVVLGGLDRWSQAERHGGDLDLDGLASIELLDGLDHPAGGPAVHDERGAAGDGRGLHGNRAVARPAATLRPTWRGATGRAARRRGWPATRLSC